MKYSELEKLLKKHGCYQISNKDHPIWFCPKTNKSFRTSHHKNAEVKKGTLSSILKDAGIK
jgi:predicted RNA binding protein YcfA (HicA-like mRNA interferase family)